ncbi:transposase [Paraburkholderia sp. LEh10]|uniref:transposase n=1 Tax=Paraburkholderia sp. LEh10 TaxID=2821353 RepID=UPI0028AB3ED7|nr:transposase [Paraburkholderia sp. LEh10]
MGSGTHSTPEQEDDRRLHRELERLRKEHAAHTNRIRSLLVLHNLRVRYVGGRIWTHWWTRQRELLAPGLRAELEREYERLALVRQQIRLLEVQQDRQVRSGAHPGMALLAQLAGIGAGSACTLVRELFGWRQFRNRRELAGCLGLTPTPYASGTSEVELGISKAGNWRCRWLMVELAWSWLRLQPGSQLSRWFNQRLPAPASGCGVSVSSALARRLAIALWRYLEHGEIPAGAILKSRDVNNARA